VLAEANGCLTYGNTIIPVNEVRYRSYLYNVNNKTQARLVVGTNFRPTSDNSVACGAKDYRWSRVFAVNATISTSDSRLKTMINNIDERYEKMFMSINPVTYMWKNTEQNVSHDRVHCGFIAQQVNEAAEKNGLSSDTFSFICH